MRFNVLSSLKITHISISMNSLLTSFVHFFTQLLDLSLLIYRSSLYTVRKLVLCLKLELKIFSPSYKLSFYFAYGISAKCKVLFFTTSNLTYLFHSSWVLSQVS